MKKRPLTTPQIETVRSTIGANASASQRFKRLSAIAWRDAAIVSLLLQGLTAREIAQLRLSDMKVGGTLLVAPKWGARRTVKLDEATREYLDRYLHGADSEERAALFLSQRGRPLNTRTIERMVAKLGWQIGLKLYPGRLTACAKK